MTRSSSSRSGVLRASAARSCRPGPASWYDTVSLTRTSTMSADHAGAVLGRQPSPQTRSKSRMTPPTHAASAAQPRLRAGGAWERLNHSMNRLIPQLARIDGRDMRQGVRSVMILVRSRKGSLAAGAGNVRGRPPPRAQASQSMPETTRALRRPSTSCDAQSSARQRRTNPDGGRAPTWETQRRGARPALALGCRSPYDVALGSRRTTSHVAMGLLWIAI